MTPSGVVVCFKPVSGGYVYRAPNTWLFGPNVHFLVTEGPKAAIAATVNSSTPPLLWIAGISWIAFSAL